MKVKRSRLIKRAHQVKCKWLKREIVRLMGGEYPHYAPRHARMTEHAFMWENVERRLNSDALNLSSDYYW